MRKNNFLAILMMAVVTLSATGCGKKTVSNSDVTLPAPITEATESYSSVDKLSSLANSNATSMKWSYYEASAKKVEDYQFTDYKTLTYAEQYTKDRVDFIAASEKLKEELSDYEQYYQISKIVALGLVKGGMKQYDIDIKDIWYAAYYNDIGNSMIKSICEVYPVAYSKEKNRLIYFAGVELTDGTVSELLNVIEFIPATQVKYDNRSETEALSMGGMISDGYCGYTTDTDLITSKLTMESFDINALNNSDCFKSSLKAR